MRRILHWLTEPEVQIGVAVVNIATWSVMTVVAAVTALGNSVKYVTFISHIALLLSCFVWFVAARNDLRNKESDAS